MVLEAKTLIQRTRLTFGYVLSDRLLNVYQQFSIPLLSDLDQKKKYGFVQRDIGE